MSTTDIEIQYCVPCGHLNRAIDIQKSLLEHFGQKIAGVRLKTGDSGIFEIRVNGDRIYEKADSFDLNTVISRIEERL
jgi:selenoprotein W-related protein